MKSVKQHVHRSLVIRLLEESASVKDSGLAGEFDPKAIQNFRRGLTGTTIALLLVEILKENQMSLKTWKEIYYPTPANSAEAKAAPAAHSLRKWEGLRLNVLAEHGLMKRSQDIEEKEGDEREALWISGESCALCQAHLSKNDALLCSKCPLAEALGGKRCDEGKSSPYPAWTVGNDPEPMITALRAAVEIEAKAKAGAL